MTISKKKAAERKPVARMVCIDRCRETAAVYQNTRGYLYTRCPGCKCNQDNSPARQVKVWQHLEPIAGVALRRPHNVPASAGEPGCALRGPAPVAVIETEPAAIGVDPAPVPAPEAAPAPAENLQKADENLPDPAPAPAPDMEPAPAPAAADTGKGGNGLLWAGVIVCSSLLAGALTWFSGATTKTTYGSKTP